MQRQLFDYFMDWYEADIDPILPENVSEILNSSAGKKRNLS